MEKIRLSYLFFLFLVACHTFLYILNRYKVYQSLRTRLQIELNLEKKDYENRKIFDKFDDIDAWIMGHQSYSNTEEEDMQCRGMVVRIPTERVDELNICRKLTEGVCGISTYKIYIPADFEGTLVSSSGVKLEPDSWYCINQDVDKSQGCDPIWGYREYSLEMDRWECKSLYPGIYNASNNSFDACKQDPQGTFIRISNNNTEEIVDYSKTTPQDVFYNQSRYKCSCNTPGYIANDELSRSTCFLDPCLVGLPPKVVAPGYNFITKECNCGVMYTNIHQDPYKPCTVCPDPRYDSNTNILELWIPCQSKGGSYPCTDSEDIERGCMKAQIIVKPTKKDPKYNDQFTNRFISPRETDIYTI